MRSISLNSILRYRSVLTNRSFCSIRLLSQGKGVAAQELRRSSGSTDAGFALRRYVRESVSSGSPGHPASNRSLEAIGLAAESLEAIELAAESLEAIDLAAETVAATTRSVAA